MLAGRDLDNWFQSGFGSEEEDEGQSVPLLFDTIMMVVGSEKVAFICFVLFTVFSTDLYAGGQKTTKR